MYDPDDDESLWPDDGYAVIEMDEMKHPSDDEYMIMLGQFDDPDEVVIPAEKEGYTYYIHGADGESWSREQWHTFTS
jgi:hypothetical protein